ncbi:hypothetical protein E3E12_01220 [Formicincola oecophyllae]|uniref:Uncharacterized protein n=1 Tax=Formicincola oecophyllae TaxID=2558361 RepID=A0A4Y6U9K6_9PROT|nr:hypothetical protein [Formicincola oecophyllae]QDH13041.1 hypothetical protein E3E12_01220 [Formicincola oecophyllae]
MFHEQAVLRAFRSVENKARASSAGQWLGHFLQPLWRRVLAGCLAVVLLGWGGFALYQSGLHFYWQRHVEGIEPGDVLILHFDSPVQFTRLITAGPHKGATMVQTLYPATDMEGHSMSGHLVLDVKRITLNPTHPADLATMTIQTTMNEGRDINAEVFPSLDYNDQLINGPGGIYILTPASLRQRGFDFVKTLPRSLVEEGINDSDNSNNMDPTQREKMREAQQESDHMREERLEAARAQLQHKVAPPLMAARRKNATQQSARKTKPGRVPTQNHPPISLPQRTAP